MTGADCTCTQVSLHGKGMMCLPACRYELFVDDLPIWGFVGPPPEETGATAGLGEAQPPIYIYTHKKFDVNYNGNRVSTALHGAQQLGSSQWLKA